MPDIQKVIQTLISTEFGYGRRERPEKPPVVITVSRDFGSGGREIGQRLANRLGIDLYDKRILDAVSDAAKVDRDLMARLDEKVREAKDTWIFNLLSAKNASMASYRHHLVDVALCVAQQGGVIIGRGAHLVLANRGAFRLRVVGSVGRCAERVAQREGITPEAARERVLKVNAERDQFVDNLFHHRLSEAATFDLVLNTDKVSNWDTATDLVLGVMTKMGFPVQAPEVHG